MRSAGRALYKPAPQPPSEEEAAAWGLTVEEATPVIPGLSMVDGEYVIDVYPDNWVAVCVFNALGTQWRVGFGGAYGLDYGVLFHKLDRLGLAAEEFDEIEADVRVLEAQALEEMREQAEADKRKRK